MGFLYFVSPFVLLNMILLVMLPAKVAIKYKTITNEDRAEHSEKQKSNFFNVFLMLIPFMVSKAFGMGVIMLFRDHDNITAKSFTIFVTVICVLCIMIMISIQSFEAVHNKNPLFLNGLISAFAPAFTYYVFGLLTMTDVYADKYNFKKEYCQYAIFLFSCSFSLAFLQVIISWIGCIGLYMKTHRDLYQNIQNDPHNNL